MNIFPINPRRLLNGAAGRLHSIIGRAQLRQCGVLVTRGTTSCGESLLVGGVVLSPPEAKPYISSLYRWAPMLASDHFHLIAEKDASRLLLQLEDKVVALPPIRTLSNYLGGVIKHWDSIEVDSSHAIRSFAGVTIVDQLAQVNYRGVRLEYEVYLNWAEESLEEVLFWGDLLPNYYSIATPPRNGLVFDLGAYHGLFGMAAAIDVGPGGRVFCFEPDPESRSVLEFNCRRNNLTNIEVIPAGVAGHTQKRAFVSLGGLGSHFGFGCEADAANTIQVYSLPDACKLVGIAAPDFVKADIEGDEIEMVEEQRDLFSQFYKTTFAVASYHHVHGVPTKNRLEKAFRKSKYQVATTREGHQTTVAWRS